MRFAREQVEIKSEQKVCRRAREVKSLSEMRWAGEWQFLKFSDSLLFQASISHSSINNSSKHGREIFNGNVNFYRKYIFRSESESGPRVLFLRILYIMIE